MNATELRLQEIAFSLAVELTIETSHIWRKLPTDYNHLQTLRSKSAWINLSIDNTRLRITSTCPRAMIKGTAAETISCNINRDPAKIAKDIYRRLLPNARELFKKSREYSRKEKDKRAELAEKMHRLRQFFTHESTSHEKTYARMHSHTAEIDLHHDKVNTLKIDSPTMEQTLYILKYLKGN